MMQGKKVVSILLFCLGLACAPFQAGASINASGLGATYTGTNQVTFKVYSAHATQMAVYIYTTAYGAAEVSSTFLTQQGSGVWSAVVTVPSGTTYYGYRAWGPNWTYSSSWTKGSATGFISDVDSAGNRFNPNKLLVDPYTLELSQDLQNPSNPTDGTMFASGGNTNASKIPYRNIDSGPYAPKGIVLSASGVSTGTKPQLAQKDDVIYEAHVRGLTKQDPSITAAYQGTYKGAGQKAPALMALGITAIEFLPTAESQNDANDVTANSDANQAYWGYGTEAFFAPDRHYSSDKSAGGPTKEFQAMVAAFHANHIKVYIDVVYNHTAEYGLWGSSDPTTTTLMSWRGLDNATYYELGPGSGTANAGFYDNSGTGANYNTYNPIAQNLIVDSLSYWINTMGVDGFRFDLAAVLGNACVNASYSSSAPNCPNGGFLFDAADGNVAIKRILKEFTVRPAGGGTGIDLFAEPWAASGTNNYQLGNFPVGWSDWNGKFRDGLRQIQNQLGQSSTPVLTTEAQFYSGSPQIFQAGGRQPWNSTNLMDVHDGMTLNDVYTCNQANDSQGWPYGPSPANPNADYSLDQSGGPAERQGARTGMAFEMLSAGTPLMQGGDEMLRNVACNNNSYNLDSPGNWINYSLSSDQTNFNTFASRLIAFRRAHSGLRPATWYTSSQMTVYDTSANVATSAYLSNASNHALGYVINGSTLGDANSIYIAHNGWSGGLNFTLPAPPTGTNWYKVADTCVDTGSSFATPGNETLLGGAGTVVSGQCGRSVLLLISK